MSVFGPARQRLSGALRSLRSAIAVAGFTVLIAGTGGAPSPTRLAPEFSLPARDGSAVTLHSFAGKVVLIDFWASWCDPCKRSFPWLATLSSRYPDSTFAVIAINLDRKRDLADGFLAKHPAPFTVLFDSQGKVAEAFHVSGMPMSYLVGKDGAIIESHPGFDAKRTADYEARIEEALGR